ncbi:serine/threonine protein phosphatase 1 [Pedobacter suwonensis]|uniref:Serine/threonine protein phosphatase 1 n=1 Tax=Pedobacter suwonensis TaxID=332999 RepID=A0A1I0T127_9SPHI|nr:metallophosphoesterase family protein [Pedobacter suwonensis]SFA45465.1 serine/threonine protein phosphatase 1 [Pedobacter suwonensis]
MGRTLVIGDIHGGLKGLIQLFERAGVSKEDKLIFLGDYVDGWSESAQVIDHLIRLDESHQCIFIKGNHDAWCIDWLEKGIVDEVWFVHGGKLTMDSYRNLSDGAKKEHLNFFKRMKDYHVDGQNNLFIHAGFSSMHGPEKERYSSNYSWDRTLWEMALAMDNRIKKDAAIYPKRLLLYHEIYIGHTPTLYYNTNLPMQGCSVWNIDTGAAFTGKLSCLDIETKQFWQSDTLQSLYPNEKGRNK